MLHCSLHTVSLRTRFYRQSSLRLKVFNYCSLKTENVEPVQIVTNSQRYAADSRGCDVRTVKSRQNIWQRHNLSATSRRDRLSLSRILV
jgi:hypothetical protein